MRGGRPTFCSTGTLTLRTEDDDDPFDWVDETDEEQFPHSKETVREHYEGKAFVKNVATTNHGLAINARDYQKHSSFGILLAERGWSVDYVDWEDGIVHISPVPEEVLQA